MCFFSFLSRRATGSADEKHLLTESSPFDMKDALEMLPPDVFLKRNEPLIPSILLTSEQFLSIQQRLPGRFQGRRWRLLFSTEHHGFSHTAMQRNSAEEIQSSRGKEQPAILLIAAGSDGQILLGTYFSCIPQPSGRKYTGSEETFVFCQSQSSASPWLVRFFSPPEVAPNRYFFRLESGVIAVGGGGKGPAITLHSDFSRVACSTECPTFGLTQSLLLLGGESELVSGVTLEGGEPRAVVRAVQLWTIGDEYFSIDHCE